MQFRGTMPTYDNRFSRRHCPPVFYECILHYFAVSYNHHAFAKLGDVEFVRNHYNRSSLIG